MRAVHGRTKLPLWIVAALLGAGLAVHAQQVVAKAQTVDDLQRSFMTPPEDARPMMRWWWFGPAVEKPELEREILAMKAGGIGGFEIQPVYPLAVDDASKHFRNLPYLSDEFLDAVRFANTVARQNGMRVDMTLASGWPYGGPHVPVDEAAARLRVIATDIVAGDLSVAMPAMGNGEHLLAVFAGDGSTKAYDAERLQRVTVQARDGRTAVAARTTPGVVVFYVMSRTGQQVKRAALNAEGFVLDPLNRTAVDNHLHVVGERLMKAFGAAPPYAVFSDSLEVFNADWTDDLPAEFLKRRGYDLLQYLPQLVAGGTDVARAVRHDWGVTLTELMDERYLTPINDWAQAHHTRFRSQTYGNPAVTLSSNRLVALPEGEGPQWNTFSFTRWATSASHLYGRPVTSAETWTWLHSPAFRATPLDMKAEADRFFLEGVNQLVGHGWPYTPLVNEEPGWSFYAAGVFNDHNPWWTVMPDVTKYLQRVSYLLRQGAPANDVAILLPTDDAYAGFSLGTVGVSDAMKTLVPSSLMQSVLSAGYNVDYIDAEAIAQVGIPYPVLVLPRTERMSPETLKKIQAYVDGGGKVVCVGAMPTVAPGLMRAREQSAELQVLSQAFEKRSGAVRFVSQGEAVGAALQQMLAPDVALSSDRTAVGFLHRKMPDADAYFVVNTSNAKVHTTAVFRTARKNVSQWDPFSGVVHRLDEGPVTLDLAPYESRVVLCSDAPFGLPVEAAVGEPQVLGDLTQGWQVRFPGLGEDVAADDAFDAPQSWTDAVKTKFYSGTAVYSKTVTLAPSDMQGMKHLYIDFGEGTPVDADPNILSGMRALLEGPVREAAVVLVNGKRVGSVWHPPYRLELTEALHAGDNHVEIRVANTAINGLAGRAPADYRLLWARYGQRFVPQNMDNLQPLPSGLLGRMQLLEVK